MDLSFEYLMAKEKLQWITVTSEQAILMSVCLQSIVDELMLKKTGARMKEVKWHFLEFQIKFNVIFILDTIIFVLLANLLSKQYKPFLSKKKKSIYFDF